MNLSARVGIDVSKTDNGWVLEWKDERMKRDRRFAGVGFDDDGAPTRGIEVFTDKEALIKRIAQLI